MGLASYGIPPQPWWNTRHGGLGSRTGRWKRDIKALDSQVSLEEGPSSSTRLFKIMNSTRISVDESVG